MITPCMAGAYRSETKFRETFKILEKQRKVGTVLESSEKARIIHELTKTGGAERYENELKSALAA